MSKDALQKMFCFYSMHTLNVHKNYPAVFFGLLWECIVQVRKILRSANIKIVFSTPSFVETPNFMRVASLVWPENNLKLCYLSGKKTTATNETSTLVMIVHQPLII